MNYVTLYDIYVYIEHGRIMPMYRNVLSSTEKMNGRLAQR